MPHPTTLMKLTTRCGSTAVDGLNEALLAKAAEAKVLRTNRVRADTTVVPANVAYPTDSGLLAKAIRRIGTHRETDPRRRRRGPDPAAGPVPSGRQPGHTAIAAKLRSRAQLGRDQVKAGVQRITGELADLAQAAINDARNAAGQRPPRGAPGQSRRPPGRPPPGCAMRPPGVAADGWSARSTTCPTLLEATEQIIGQTRQRIAGITPDGATRVVSLHDTDARPIAKGRLGKPVEFGYKAQVVDNDDGIVAGPRRASWEPA